MAAKKTSSSNTGSPIPTRTRTEVSSQAGSKVTVTEMNSNIKQMAKLTPNELAARQLKKYATTSSNNFSSRMAGDTSSSSGGNFYSPQLSTDFLEKPQNLRERRAWYRHFYNSNEFVGQAIDLHSQLPLSKIRLEKPKCENPDTVDYVYDFFVEMCDDVKLFKSLLEISHEYWLLGNCVRPDCRVRASHGFVRIEDIKVGDFVLTHKNRYRKVSKKITHRSDSILNIKVFKNIDTIGVTKEHPMEVYRDGKFLFVEAKDLKRSDYIRATWPAIENDIENIEYLNSYKDIVKTDNGYSRTVTVGANRNREAQECREKLSTFLGTLSLPLIKTREDLSKDLGINRKTLDNVLTQMVKEFGKESFSRRVGAKGFQEGSQVEWLPFEFYPGDGSYEISRTNSYIAPSNLDIDDDFCYLLGYWLGDGTLARDNSRKDSWGRGIWNIVFGEYSGEHQKRVYNILKDKFGANSISESKSIRDYNGRAATINTLRLKGNPYLLEWWSENFGETCLGLNKKRIPQWVTNLPKKKLLNLLAGLVDSDGCVSDMYTSITTVSKDLSDSIREISLKCGLVPGVNKSMTNPNPKYIAPLKNYKSRPVYTVSLVNWYNKETLSKYTTKEIKTFKEPNVNSKRFIVTDGGDVAYKIKSICDESYNGVVINLEVEEDHTFQVEGLSTHNCFIFAEDHSPYEGIEEGRAAELKEAAKIQSKKLFEEFKITDKDPNYKGWRKLLVLPPDQVRIRKIPLSDESLIEYLPDPETRKSIIAASNGQQSDYLSTLEGVAQPGVPDKLIDQIRENGSIPLDTDPYSGSHVHHLARKKSQYETLGVSVLERCVNTLLLFDKLRQAQTQIASRHMTPIRIVWAEELSEGDIENLREQVDLALMDPDFSIIANYEVHWEEMGSNGRLLELSTEYEHIENSLFAGLGVTREMLTGEGTYAGGRVTLEILNTQYLLFRELLQEYVENNLFKPIAKKKGFIEYDKYGREKLIYPKLSFTRLAIRDNDAFFDQAFQLYNKGSVSIDIILDMLNIDPEATRKKIEADLFTVNDFAFNQLISNAYSSVAQPLVDQYDLQGKIADYLGLPPMPQQEGEEGGGDEGGLGGLGGGGARFASTEKPKEVPDDIHKKIAAMKPSTKKALDTLIRKAANNPEKLSQISRWLDKKDFELEGKK